MVNNTVNGKKIGTPAGKGDKVIAYYCNVGKKSREEELDVGKAGKYSLIETLRENGEIIKETTASVTIRAYDDGKSNKETKNNDDITH